MNRNQKRRREVPDWDWTGIGVVIAVIIVGLLAWLVLTLTHASVPSCPPGHTYDVQIQACD